MHYNQALDLTKGLISELRAHGGEISIESLEQRIRKRDRILRKAIQTAKSLAQKEPGDETTGLRRQAVRRVAQEVHDRGNELIGLLARVKDETRDDLYGYKNGAKLMKAYKGFKVRAPKRLSREA